jgi:hypothetical protein
VVDQLSVAVAAAPLVASPLAVASSSGHGGRLSSDPVEPLEPELALGLAVGVDDCASAALAPAVPTVRARR